MGRTQGELTANTVSGATWKLQSALRKGGSSSHAYEEGAVVLTVNGLYTLTLSLGEARQLSRALVTLSFDAEDYS